MSSKLKVAIFDFDDTLYKGQSLNHFINFLEYQLSLSKRVLALLRKRFEGRSTDDNRLHKEFLLKPFIGIDEKKMLELGMQFYESRIRHGLSKEVLNGLNNHKNQGYYTILASGGFDIYLNDFVNEHDIDLAITSSFLFRDGKFTGEIKGKEVLGMDKRNEIVKLTSNMPIDWAASYFYSDHASDKPTFELVGNKVLVTAQGKKRDWIDSNYSLLIV